jgi:hypothetical protein
VAGCPLVAARQHRPFVQSFCYWEPGIIDYPVEGILIFLLKTPKWSLEMREWGVDEVYEWRLGSRKVNRITQGHGKTFFEVQIRRFYELGLGV